jgi:putative FmdB family regulatory protein
MGLEEFKCQPYSLPVFDFFGVVMPIYEYQCNACGHEHEALQKLGAEPLVICPACNEAELKKKISAAGFRLKGGGWYETDFKSGSKKNVAGESSSGTSSSSSNSSGGSCGSSCACH